MKPTIKRTISLLLISVLLLSCLTLFACNTEAETAEGGFDLQGNFGLPKDNLAYRIKTQQKVADGVCLTVFYGRVPPPEGEKAEAERSVALYAKDGAGALYALSGINGHYPSADYECYYVFDAAGREACGVEYLHSEALTLPTELFFEKQGEFLVCLYETDGEVPAAEPLCAQTLYYRKTAFGRVRLSNAPVF